MKYHSTDSIAAQSPNVNDTITFSARATIQRRKVRIGIPPAPRPQGGYEFPRLSKIHRAALKERGWRFYVIYVESVEVDEAGNATPRTASGSQEGGATS